MPKPVRTRRKNAFNLHREAERLASFDEFPLLRPEVDPQMHASRNSVDQPFYLCCAKDTVIAQMSGHSRIEFITGPVRYFELGMGDFTYVPAGQVHRLLTRSEGTVIRYKAADPGEESTVHLCENCGAELFRHTWNASAVPVQEGYQAASEAFNADPALRHCSACGSDSAPIDLEPFRWNAVAEKLREADND